MLGNKKQAHSPVKVPPGKRKLTGNDTVEASNVNISDANSMNVGEVVELALARQQASLEAIVTRVVQVANGAVISAVESLQEKVDVYMEKVKKLDEKVDRVQAESRFMKKEISGNSSELEKMHLKIASLEDQDRRNNVRITGIAAGREGGDAVAFLQDMLPKWIPSLGAAKIQIERAHRIYSTKKDRQATLIFRVLRHGDRNAILQGAREARRNAPIQDAGKTIRFYADYSAFTNGRRREFAAVQKELHERGVPAFLLYPATLKMTFKGEQRTFTSAEEAARFLNGETGDERSAPCESRRKLFALDGGDATRLNEEEEMA